MIILRSMEDFLVEHFAKFLRSSLESVDIKAQAPELKPEPVSRAQGMDFR